MIRKPNNHTPFIATHPGELLKDELKERDIKQNSLAKLINQPAPVINDIIKGKRSINAEMAVLLESVLGIPSQYWLNLQNQYDIDSANINEKIIQTKKNIALWQVISSYIPVAIFTKLGYINDNVAESIEQLKAIFKFKDIDQLIENFSAQIIPELYRKSDKQQINEVNLFGWRYLARWISEQQILNTSFDVNSEKLLTANLNAIFYENTDTLNKLRKELNEHGIKFIVLEKFDKTPVDGISFWEGENPTVVVTLRYKRIDNLAFSLMHEIAHIYHHHSKNSGKELINFDFQNLTDTEKDADTIAQDYLIQRNDWKKLTNSLNFNTFAAQKEIQRFAAIRKINPAIALGRYKKEMNQYAIKSFIDFDIC